MIVKSILKTKKKLNLKHDETIENYKDLFKNLERFNYKVNCFILTLCSKTFKYRRINIVYKDLIIR